MLKCMQKVKRILYFYIKTKIIQIYKSYKANILLKICSNF